MAVWMHLVISFLASTASQNRAEQKIRTSHATALQTQPILRDTKLASTMAAHFTTTTTDTKVSQQRQPKPRINWMIRPATVHDRDGCAALIQRSFGTLLTADYTAECLATCLPRITTPRQQLLTCNTWYVAEHPSTRQIVGCGGWTVRSPPPPPPTDRPDDDGSGSGETEPNEKSDEPTIPQQPVPQLRHFAVHPYYTRQGVASALWNRTYHEIQQRYCEAENLPRPFPVLEVYSTLTAEAFYASCGFVKVQRVEFELVQDSFFPSLLMRREATHAK